MSIDLALVDDNPNGNCVTFAENLFPKLFFVLSSFIHSSMLKCSLLLSLHSIANAYAHAHAHILSLLFLFAKCIIQFCNLKVDFPMSTCIFAHKVHSCHIYVYISVCEFANKKYVCGWMWVRVRDLPFCVCA